MKWTATLEFWFTCPDCGLTVLEGNPKKCPHQHGPRALYNPVMDGRVENWEYILRQMGMEQPMDVQVGVKKVKRKALTTDEVVSASCSHGV